MLGVATVPVFDRLRRRMTVCFQNRWMPPLVVSSAPESAVLACNDVREPSLRPNAVWLPALDDGSEAANPTRSSSKPKCLLTSIVRALTSG